MLAAFRLPAFAHLQVDVEYTSWHVYLRIHSVLRELIVHSGTSAEVYIDDRVMYRYERVGPEPRAATPAEL